MIVHHIKVVCSGRIVGRSRARRLIGTKKETTVKTKIYSVILALGCLMVMSVFAADQASKEEVSIPAPEGQPTNPEASIFKTEQDKVSYIIGTQLGQSIKKQGVEVNFEPLILGLQDSLENRTPKLTKEEIQKVYTAFLQRRKAKQAAERKKQATENLAKGKAFLEANKTKEGVKVLPSGLQYKVIKEGTGAIPTADNKVKTHYRGRLLDGTEFDSSYKRNQPAEFPVKGVIKGWTEALQLMKTGAKWELYIPADLAYGERGRPSIPPNSVLIFEIELLEIVKPQSSPPDSR
jgi:FKBP-type peptidyl-prolyl cis-trans isomerase